MGRIQACGREERLHALRATAQQGLASLFGDAIPLGNVRVVVLADMG